MKKITILLILTFLFFTGCEKANEASTYEKADLIGKWKQVDPDPVDEDGNCIDYSVVIDITADYLESITNCDEQESSISVTYDFDGKVFSYNFFFDMTMTIVELTDTRMVTDQVLVDFGVSERITYTKLQ